MSEEREKVRNKVVIVGAGPAGLLLAHYLLRRPGYDIVIVERRSNPRTTSTSVTPPSDGDAMDKESTRLDTRSYPVSLQARGKEALSLIPGLVNIMDNRGVYCDGVCIHKDNIEKASTKEIRISKKPTLSVDRNEIALILLTELEKRNKDMDRATALTTTVQFLFSTSLQKVDTENSKIDVITSNNSSSSSSSSSNKSYSISFDHLVAADGARSKIRQQLAESVPGPFQFFEADLPDDYRTIYLKRESQDKTIKLMDDKVHVWMKDDIKIITAPIHDGCVSGAFVFPKEKDPFKTVMKSPVDVIKFFQSNFPASAAKLLSNEEAENILARPTSKLSSIRCNRLHVDNPVSVVLLGDAAHAVSASLGQGCNSALQDVLVFGGLLDQYNDDWTKILPAYTQQRLPDAHAISELSDYGMARSKWMKTEWLFRVIMKKMLPGWLHTLIGFRPMPMELLTDTNLSYTAVLGKAKWWIDRVKKSADAA